MSTKTKTILLATRKVWINREGDKLVPEGDSSAAILFARKGQRVRAEDVEKFGAAPKGFFDEVPNAAAVPGSASVKVEPSSSIVTERVTADNAGKKAAKAAEVKKPKKPAKAKKGK